MTIYRARIINASEMIVEVHEEPSSLVKLQPNEALIEAESPSEARLKLMQSSLVKLSEWTP